MKIAVLVNSFPALSETFILNQITGLLEMGHEVSVFSRLRPAGQKFHRDILDYELEGRTHYLAEIPRNKTIRRLKTLVQIILNFPRGPVKIMRALRILLNREEGFPYPLLYFVFLFLGREFDVVHCHFGPLGIVGVLLKQTGFDVKFVTTFHGFDANCYPRKTGLDVYNELFKEGDLFTANTNFTKGQIVKLGCCPNKVRILPVGLKIEKFPFSPRQYPKDGPVRILTVARLVEKKGYEYSIRAVGQLVKSGRRVLYTIAGDGPLESELKKLVCELGIEKHVEFLGALVQEEIIELYSSCLLYTSPSPRDRS